MVEVAVCITDIDFTPLATWHTMIDPQVAVLNADIHGLTDDHLTTAPTFEQIMPALCERLAGLRLIAHNARFDAGFLTAECQRAGTDFCSDPDFTWIDSLHLARRILSGSHRLDALCQRFEITNPAPHMALGDVLATTGVLRAIQKKTRSGLAWIHRCSLGSSGVGIKEMPFWAGIIRLVEGPYPQLRRASLRCNYLILPRRCLHRSMTRTSCQLQVWSRSCAWPMSPACPPWLRNG
ncbi:hypothetical protein A605_03600 [Corynebacterium halotolerans YIM 70093 = DSM 44683]|uniref:Exonuclease domain-containing protein n=1 Tax=Corynebacterium halotolerans YIM 70093 = DSM 44683 TaxID=1121362 RepID=M1P4Y9_9CORY|nr:hypothetical protein A605_03600 [Corynebacterium halotolerans YIM 70093 = DSM 44683]